MPVTAIIAVVVIISAVAPPASGTARRRGAAGSSIGVYLAILASFSARPARTTIYAIVAV